MGHLLMPGPVGSLTQGVISVWFRIPTPSVTAARSKPYDPWPYGVFNQGCIPLLTWGEQLKDGAGRSLPPSHIGVRVGAADYNWGQETLEVHLQTSTFSSGSGDHWATNNYPDWFGNSGMDFNDHGGAGFPAVLVDRWNHLLLSWELTSNSVNNGGLSGSASKMWCAINDLGKDGAELPAMATTRGLGANDHLSNHVADFLSSELHSASLGVPNVPSNLFAVPARTVSYTTNAAGNTANKNPVLRVEMAELQVFAGVTLDVGVPANRRAFVNADGEPVSPNAVDADGTPIGSVALLRKEPEILLLGSGDWSRGYNSGSIGTRRNEAGEPVPNPAGQFTPTGKINSWEPDPSLRGPQSLAPPPGVRLTGSRDLVGSS